MLMQTKTCRNCKYFRPNKSWISHQYRISYGECTHPIFHTIDLVSGIVTYQNASTLRMQKDKCGPLGTYHIPEPNHFNLFIREVYWPEVMLYTTFAYCFIIVLIKALTSKT